KGRRIQQIHHVGHKFYPPDQQNPKNKDFDWLYGNEGTGYQMVDGAPTLPEGKKGLAPWNYMIDRSMWAPSDEANQYHRTYKTKEYRKLAKELEEMHARIPHYDNPIHQVYSETFIEKGQEITLKLLNEQARIITGDRPLSDWDRLVQEYLEAGGAQIIEEVNREIRKNNIRPGWKRFRELPRQKVRKRIKGRFIRRKTRPSAPRWRWNFGWQVRKRSRWSKRQEGRGRRGLSVGLDTWGRRSLPPRWCWVPEA